MPRPRASDHDSKRRAILDRAAELFAGRGYTRTSMAEIAEACGVSKALLYHYYENKEQLLFDLLEAHFVHLLATVEAADDATLTPQLRLRALVGGLLDAYDGADAVHRVQINDLATLPAERQNTLKEYERRLVALFADALADANPRLRRSRFLKPVTMSLFGMLNWHHMWFRPGGPLSREEYADLATRIMTNGIASLAAEPAARTKRARIDTTA